MTDGVDHEIGGEADVVVAETALTVVFRGDRFDGGRLPVSALATIEKVNGMVAAIARDLEVAARDDAVRSSPLAKVELTLVGEIEDGSASLRLLITPLVAAMSLAGQASQAALIQSLPDAVPIIVQQVHSGSALSYPVSDDTVQRVAEVGQRLGALDEMVLRPAIGADLDASLDAVSAVVTLASTNEARTAREVKESRSFFVTGTLRQLENHGDNPGKLTLATASGLYSVPSVEAGLVERAAGLISKDRNTVLAISGTGEFDGKGRLKKLTHLSEMQTIDRAFDPERRLAELTELADSAEFGAFVDRARSTIEGAALESGRAPGLFANEEGQLEARWLVSSVPDVPARVVSVAFGRSVEVYVFDRALGEVTSEETFQYDELALGDRIAAIIGGAAEDSSA